MNSISNKRYLTNSPAAVAEKESIVHRWLE